MLEFKTIEELKPNTKLLTNLQFIEPTEYLITYPITLTIFEYKVNEISNKPFYIKEHKQKYNIKEVEKIIQNATFDNK